MKTAVEDVAKTIIDASCPSATEPCIDKDYIMEKMSKIEVTRLKSEFLAFVFSNKLGYFLSHCSNCENHL